MPKSNHGYLAIIFTKLKNVPRNLKRMPKSSESANAPNFKCFLIIAIPILVTLSMYYFGVILLMEPCANLLSFVGATRRLEQHAQIDPFAALPNVPFYMYDGDAIRNITAVCKGQEQYRDNYAAEFEFLIALENHPWRVYDPETAVLFVLPLKASPMLREACEADITFFYDTLADEIQHSWMYRRYGGRDHIVVEPDFMLPSHLRRRSSKLTSVLRNFIVGTYYAPARYFWRCTVLVPTIPSATIEDRERVKTQLAEMNIENWAQRENNLMFQGSTHHDKKDFKNRRQILSDLAGKFSPSVLVSNSDSDKYPMCNETTRLEGCYEDKNNTMYLERLLNSKFGIHVRGDDPHSFRFYDYLAGGQIPIVAAKNFVQWVLPFQCDVPWTEMVQFIPANAFTAHPVETIHEALTRSTEEWTVNALELIKNNSKHFLWQLDRRQVSENVLRHAVRRCLPDEILDAKQISRDDFFCRFPNDEMRYGNWHLFNG